jgi:hypothetical protein
MELSLNTHYIYLIHEREFIKSKESIYKIGRTQQTNLKRIYQYPKDSKVLLLIECDDCKECERELIKMFKEKYTQRTDIGKEYFEGSEINIVNDILQYFLTKNQSKTNDIIEPEEEKVIKSAAETTTTTTTTTITTTTRTKRAEPLTSKNGRSFSFTLEKYKSKYACFIDNIVAKKDFEYLCCCVTENTLFGYVRFTHTKPLGTVENYFQQKALVIIVAKDDEYYKEMYKQMPQFKEYPQPQIPIQPLPSNANM